MYFEKINDENNLSYTEKNKNKKLDKDINIQKTKKRNTMYAVTYKKDRIRALHRWNYIARTQNLLENQGKEVGDKLKTVNSALKLKKKKKLNTKSARKDP